MSSVLAAELAELSQKLKDSDSSYLVENITICENSLYLRVDTADNTVKENESEAYEICEDLLRVGYKVIDRCVEHDCITGTVIKIEPEVSTSVPSFTQAEIDSFNQLARPELTPAKIYAWCESLMKGAKRCREQGDAGDAATLDDIAAYFRRRPESK